MNLLNVKSTIVDTMLDWFAPHYCCSCGEIGALLCDSCKHNITQEQYTGCLLCGRPALSICSHCNSLVERTWCGGERSGGLETLINRFKFEYARAAYVPLGDVLLAALPQLPKETIVVPIPTIRSHVRQRGYDHTLLLAGYIARRQGVMLARPLTRRTSTLQRGATRKIRMQQAKEAFAVATPLEKDIPYLLVDDVVTTGSTLRYAAETLKNAGATVVWAAAVARQPLDEQR
jgi:ComF family protein